MNNYRLYIQDISGIWHIADMGDDKPAMNYQVNNIAELKDRQCDYSQNLKLPPTPINCGIFGYSDQLDVITSVPYRKLNCRLFCNESVIAGIGSYLILDKVIDSFEVQILSGNVDLFETLKSKTMNDLDLGFWQIGTGDFGLQKTRRKLSEYSIMVAQSHRAAATSSPNISSIPKQVK